MDVFQFERISFPLTLKKIPCFANEVEGLPKLKSVVLAEGIEKIADGAFCHHKNLKTIIFQVRLKKLVNIHLIIQDL